MWPAVRGVESIGAAIEYGMWDRASKIISSIRGIPLPKLKIEVFVFCLQVLMFANEDKNGGHTLSTLV